VKPGDLIVSLSGKQYTVGAQLGRGGQGTVFSIEDGDRLAVKELFATQGTREQLQERLATVRRLPVKDMTLARPLELLRAPHVGYLMEVLTGMVPLGSLISPQGKVSSRTSWYLRTGGLRRRLRLLAKTADILAELHGKGLIYLDPSPGNIFISEDKNEEQVYLIDTDNLRVVSTPGKTLVTPYYGAPELLAQTLGPTSLSDAYAFATLAFQTLAIVHPLIGDMVQYGDAELEEDALNGKLPWIEHPTDDSNRATDGVPRQIILSKELRRNFEQMFGAGLLDPQQRPSMAQWAECLHRAADRTLLCPQCQGSYYDPEKACPWCEATRPRYLLVGAQLWDPERVSYSPTGEEKVEPGVLQNVEGKPIVLDAIALSEGEERILTERITHGTTRSTPTLRIKVQYQRLSLCVLKSGSWLLGRSTGREEPLVPDKARDFDLKDIKYLRVGRSGCLHRVLTFTQYQERT
jgi:DNA-binding helix-hairpin-helix protein with protein kinase domain